MATGRWTSVAGRRRGARHRRVLRASKDTPIERRLYAVSYRDAGRAHGAHAGRRLVDGDGGQDRRRLRRHLSRSRDPAAHRPLSRRRDAGALDRGERARRRPSRSSRTPARLRAPSSARIKAADGQDLWWSMRTPPGFDPTKRYPVIVQVYGGPARRDGAQELGQPERPAAPRRRLHPVLASTTAARPTARSPSRPRSTAARARSRSTDQLAGVALSEDAALRRSGAHRRHRLVQRRLHDPDAADRARTRPSPRAWRARRRRTGASTTPHYTERYMGTPSENPRRLCGSPK